MLTTLERLASDAIREPGATKWQRSSDEAFAHAIECGAFTERSNCLNTVDDFMYMWTVATMTGDVDVFKHRDTRQYFDVKL